METGAVAGNAVAAAAAAAVGAFGVVGVVVFSVVVVAGAVVGAMVQRSKPLGTKQPQDHQKRRCWLSLPQRSWRVK